MLGREPEPPRPETPADDASHLSQKEDEDSISEAERVISPAVIGEYISFDQCPRYFKHKGQDIDESWYFDGNDFEEAFEALNLLLSKAGKEFEERVVQDLTPPGREAHDFERDVDEFEPDHAALQKYVQQALDEPAAPEQPIVLCQLSLTGQIGEWHIGGDADVVLLWPTDKGVHIRVIDAKSTREQKPYHQIQAATYADLIKKRLAELEEIRNAEITVDGGIVSRESDFVVPTVETVPSFDTEPRIMDVHRLLGPEGRLTKLADEEFEDVSYQLDKKCARCAYNEGCVTDAFEDGHLRLLGLSIAQQEILADHGVTTVKELAGLCSAPDDTGWYPTNYRKAVRTNPTYRELEATSGVGELFPTLVYRAQALLNSFKPDESGVADYPRSWIPGTGRCNLPEDSPPEETEIEHDWMHGSMIRVYLNVQVDHLRDRLIQLSGRVTATASDTEARRLSHLTDSVPDNDADSTAAEQVLLERFIDDLYDAIHQVNDGIDYNEDEQQMPPIHFYVYASHERTALDEAFDRHETTQIDSFQSLLEGQAGRNSPMMSALRPVISKHIGLQTPSAGLLHSYDELYPPEGEYRKPRGKESWSYTSSEASESVHLRRVFSHRLFDTGVACERSADGVSVDPEQPDQITGLNTRMRYGAEIPLGYQWVAAGRINEQWIEELDDDFDIEHFDIARYRYHDGSQQQTPITEEDVEALGRHLCDAMEHVERSLNSRDSQLSKEPYPLTKLPTDRFSQPSLAASANRYLWIEHTAQREEEYEHYRKYPPQRMLSGNTLPVHITDVEEKNSRTLRVEAQLRFGQAFSNNAKQIQRSCRKKGADGTTGGSWMVANAYSYGQIQAEVDQPYEIESGVQVTIEELDLEDSRIVFEATNFYGDSGIYGRSHDYWTLDEDRDTDNSRYLLFQPNEQIILDPQTDDIVAGRTKAALDHAEANQLHERLEEVRFGQTPVPKTANWDLSKLEKFAEWMSENVGPPTLPSKEQSGFITEGTHQFVGLQGPPGTGKTAGAMAPAVCARAYSAASRGEDTNILVTATSNTAIRELLENIAELTQKSQDSSNLEASMSSLELVRIADDRPDDAPDNVRYLSYNNSDDDAAIRKLGQQILSTSPPGEENATADSPSQGNAKTAAGDSQATLGQYDESASGEDSDDGEEAQQTVIFATPSRAWRLIKEIISGKEDTDVASCECWDAVIVDEASMMTLPKFLLAGSGLRETGQVLVGGDHRQLPPVQKHNWTEEPRRGIRSTVPYLSVLDYFRLLRGEEDVLDEDRLADWHHDRDPDATEIPLPRLSKTYRFGTTTADILQKAVYRQDDIKYTSAVDPDPHISPNVQLPDFLAAVYENTAPIILITYDSAKSYQQWNPIEELLTVALVNALPAGVSRGVVTPHNAQRSRIQSQLSDSSGSDVDSDDETVETVNRFQGGEADVMLLSGTVSDPQYISDESEFLLSENRINVSLSRHKEKLIMLVPRSILGFIPQDVDLYDEARIWKLLSKISGESPTEIAQNASWEDTLGSILGEKVLSKRRALKGEAGTMINVYEIDWCL